MPQRIIDRIRYCKLTEADLKTIDEARRARQSRIYEYRPPFMRNEKRTARLHEEHVGYHLPLGIVVPELTELAIDFWQDPDARLMSGYRKLEEATREKANVHGHGSKLFADVFLSTPAKLEWDVPDAAEQKGRGQLFTAAYMAHRNPRAHRTPSTHEAELVSEFMVLNHLFRLLSEAEIPASAIS